MGSPRALGRSPYELPAEFSALRARLRDLDERVAAERSKLRSHNLQLGVPSELEDVTDRLLQVCDRLDLETRSRTGGSAEHACDLGVLCHRLKTSVGEGKSIVRDTRRRGASSCSTSCSPSD